MGIIDGLKRMFFGAKSEPVEQSSTRATPQPEQTILLCIESQLRVINDSIEIARKSKTLETRISRLEVARNTLKMARNQASQFALEIEGFDKAEAEINRIDEAIKAGAPTEIVGMQQIELNAGFSSVARNLLKEATALKKEKKYVEACDKLRDAYTSEGAENLMIEDRLRLPMYLQLAGKNDEGWNELNRLYAKYTDQFSQPIIEHQMKVFLKKEKNESASNPVRVILRVENMQPSESSAASCKANDENNTPFSAAKTVGELQSEPMSAWGDNDIIVGLRFSATMQLRTPLRVLLRHGEIHTNRNTAPPQIVLEGWEGSWVAKTTISDKLPPYEIASSIGPIFPHEYLPFLVAVRKIVEAHEPIEQRVEKLREMLTICEWQIYVDKHGGVEKIIRYFFPRFIDTLPVPEINAMTIATRNLLKEATALKKEKKYIEACAKLREAYSADGADSSMLEERLRLPMYLQLAGKNDEGWAELNRLSARYADQHSLLKIEHQMKIFLRKENNEAATNPLRVILQGDKFLESTTDVLIRLGLDTPNRIANASDETLLGIKGIGAAKLAAIRDYCAGIADNRDANLLENVTR